MIISTKQGHTKILMWHREEEQGKPLDGPKQGKEGLQYRDVITQVSRFKMEFLIFANTRKSPSLVIDPEVYIRQEIGFQM